MEKLLFVTPVMPSNTKGGREIRAYNALLTYAKNHEITLITCDSTAPSDAVKEFIHCHVVAGKRKVFEDVLKRKFRKLPNNIRHMFSPALNFADDLPIKNSQLLENISLDDFETIHIFRIYMLQWLVNHGFNIKNKKLILDIDDIDSKTLERIAKLPYSKKQGLNNYYARLSKIYRKYEDEWILKADTIQVCSEQDKDLLLQRYGNPAIEVVPNRYAITQKMSKIPFNCNIKRILFVGSMGYIPNQDAMDFFCCQILPLLKSRSNYIYHVDIVGAGMPPRLKKNLEIIEDVTYHGFQKELDTFYENANLVVCPIRAGGGTRIKILEAIAHARPVVTTQIGKEGLLFTENELAFAETPIEFFNKIIQILEDESYSNSLTLHAMKTFNTNYQME